MHGGQEWARLAHAVPADASRSECTVAPEVLHDVEVSLSKSGKSSVGTPVTEVSLLLLVTDSNAGRSESGGTNDGISGSVSESDGVRYIGIDSNDGMSAEPDETDMWR